MIWKKKCTGVKKMENQKSVKKRNKNWRTKEKEWKKQMNKRIMTDEGKKKVTNENKITKWKAKKCGIALSSLIS